jgi:hypothetical protein
LLGSIFHSAYLSYKHKFYDTYEEEPDYSLLYIPCLNFPLQELKLKLEVVAHLDKYLEDGESFYSNQI